MKKLINLPNVNGATAEFPYGDVKDNTGSNNGTPLNRESMSDIFQFFAKLADEAGIVQNDILDNEYDGFQLFEALQTVIGIKTTIISIGAWDMDATASINVAHGLGDKDRILNVSAVIINDADSARALLNGPEGAISFIDDTNVTLSRVNSGFFDSTAYDDGAMNRGFMTVQYIN